MVIILERKSVECIVSRVHKFRKEKELMFHNCADTFKTANGRLQLPEHLRFL